MLAPEDLEQEDEVSQIETNTEINTEINTQSDQVMKGVHVVATRDERKEWELWAEKAVGFEKEGMWTLDQVRAVFFAEDGVSYNVTGKVGRFELSSKNMKVNGDVKVVTSNGYVLNTDEVNYNSASRTLDSPLEVNVQGQKDAEGDYLMLRGDKMNIDLSDSLMQLIGNVKGKKAKAVKNKVSVISDKVHLSGKSYFVRFMNNVVMKLDDKRLSAPDVLFVYNKKKRKFTSLELSGGTKVSDQNKWVSARKVEVLFDLKKYIFTGSPKVVQGKDELVGEKIIFLDDGKRVKIENARAKVKKETLEKKP